MNILVSPLVAQPDFTQLPNLAAAQAGATILHCTNDELGAVTHLLEAGRGGYISETQVDGWLTHRRRQLGQEFCILRLSACALLRGLEIDTHQLGGQHAPYLAAYACCLPLDATPEEILAETDWDPLIKKMALEPNHCHYVDMISDYPYTHIKLTLYPDGGITRFRAYGTEQPAPSTGQLYTDVLSKEAGAQVVACSDEYLGAAAHVLEDSEAIWLTRRNRLERAYEWLVVKLGQPVYPNALQVDTRGVTGQAAGAYSVEGFYLPEGSTWDAEQWGEVEGEELLERLPMSSNHLHCEAYLETKQPITHLRLRLYPDGGLRRWRLWGTFA